MKVPFVFYSYQYIESLRYLSNTPREQKETKWQAIEGKKI